MGAFKPVHSLGALVVVLLAAIICAMSLPKTLEPLRFKPAGKCSGPVLNLTADGRSIRISSHDGSDMLVSTNGDGSQVRRAASGSMMPMSPNWSDAERRMAQPTSMRWSHPKFGLPEAAVVLAASICPNGGQGAVTMHTTLAVDHAPLSVVSLVAPDESLFGAEAGLLVVGNTILDPPEELASAYAHDPKFWKYPGNFHRRGKSWERRGHISLLASDGVERWQRPVALRISGQQTRGLAQHALRVMFDTPLTDTLFGAGSSGATSIVIRAAGNDQIKAMLRDAYQHRLCSGLPFEVSASRTVVLYINGAYWGVHHLRQRLDDEELGRRVGVPAKRITIVEDLGVLYRGSAQGRDELMGLLKETERWDVEDNAFLKRLELSLDVEGFLTYMAAQMILGNMDWPRQNIRFWRVEGGVPGKGAADGRWRLAMGDSDLGFGVNAGPESDLFLQVRPANAPASRLLMALLRSTVMRERFRAAALALLDDPLSASHSSNELERFVKMMEPEMERHTARWRKPPTAEAWRAEVDVMRRFARERERHARAQLESFINRGAL